MHFFGKMTLVKLICTCDISLKDILVRSCSKASDILLHVTGRCGLHLCKNCPRLISFFFFNSPDDFLEYHSNYPWMFHLYIPWCFFLCVCHNIQALRKKINMRGKLMPEIFPVSLLPVNVLFWGSDLFMLSILHWMLLLWFASLKIFHYPTRFN